MAKKKKMGSMNQRRIFASHHLGGQHYTHNYGFEMPKVATSHVTIFVNRKTKKIDILNSVE